MQEEKLEGPHGIVQLDESAIGKRKYNVGRTGNQTWIFGGTDVQTKRVFMLVVFERKLITLGLIITARVEYGSTVWTDEHPSYIAFFKNNLNYHHKTVCKS
ncbi:hypothetical protein ENBRE01_2057 [Enteropsectra breve]|nr:hypothetical protein ENBRE01_2057 [Enteropsectra breve]